MKNFFRRWRRRGKAFARMTWRRRLLLVEAFVLLGMARAMVLRVPFKRIAPKIGPLNSETSFDSEAAQQQAVAQTQWAIERARLYTPWNSNCLAQALAANVMLRRRGVASTLYLGVSKQNVNMEAHAWLRAGNVIVTGDDVRPQFTPISSFGTIGR